MYENNPSVSEMVKSLTTGDSVIIDGDTYRVGMRSEVCGPFLYKGKRLYVLHCMCNGTLRIRSNGGRGRPLDKAVTSFERVTQPACDAA